MARSFSQILLAAAVAVVVGGSALAQNSSQSTPLQEAATLLRLSKPEDATAKLREIMAGDPSPADALALYRSISQDEWFMLVTHTANGEASEIQKLSQSLIERAKVETKARSRDEAAIKALVDQATAPDADYATRQKAINKLVNDHGEFAVPPLVEKLGNRDDNTGQELAISVLLQLRTAAVLPLIEALKSGNELVVQNAAAALNMINDPRAVPAMAHLAKDERAGIRDIAQRFMTKRGATGNAVDLLVEQSKKYVDGGVAVGAFSDVVWSLQNEKLVATDVLPMLYPSELAKGCAADAVRIAPDSLAARTALATANLAQANLIDGAIASGDEAAKALEGVAAELRIAALASGIESVRNVIDATDKTNSKVAVDAIGIVAKEGQTPQDMAALEGALKSTNKAIRYSAAEALVRASSGKVQNPEVVKALAEAVAEEAVRNIQVIAPSLDARTAVETTSRSRGYAVEAAADAVEGMRKLLVNPGVDVVVINEVLPDRRPEDIIGNIKKDGRMAGTKIVVVAKDEEAAKARFGEGVGIIKAPLTGENLVAAVNTALEGVPNAANDRAEAFAISASKALNQLAGNGGSIEAAVPVLAAQLNRSDAVAIPAALALGAAGTAAELPALTAVLAGNGSVEAKKAAANGCGGILARIGECPDAVYTALVGALDAATDVGLRTAIGNALSRATLPADKRADLLQKLARKAAAPAAAGGGS